MSNFIDDDTDLPFPKDQLVAVPVGLEDKYLSNTEWNTTCQAMIDLKNHLRQRYKFEVAAAGGETELVINFVALGFANRAHANFVVHYMLGAVAAVFIPNVTAKATTGFTVACNATLTGGDVVMFTVEDKTP